MFAFRITIISRSATILTDILLLAMSWRRLSKQRDLVSRMLLGIAVSSALSFVMASTTSFIYVASSSFEAADLRLSIVTETAPRFDHGHQILSVTSLQ
ncbi:hypothetical protein BD311DRAFT_767962 [Dichomitus squalens]|uniref:Uncharacterized protein n=1 Tax=Dichomitus squalens TaxID=114155 RepID=A0A4Q9M990_9APHY|nr:hypothetical protein BD311DRAFT_767962 [Dichomitus squalens]